MSSHLHVCFFFFNAPATTEIYTLSLHDALPISGGAEVPAIRALGCPSAPRSTSPLTVSAAAYTRSEEHTSELQSRQYLVCRLLLEKKKKKTNKKKNKKYTKQDNTKNNINEDERH